MLWILASSLEFTDICGRLSRRRTRWRAREDGSVSVSMFVSASASPRPTSLPISVSRKIYYITRSSSLWPIRRIRRLRPCIQHQVEIPIISTTRDNYLWSWCHNRPSSSFIGSSALFCIIKYHPSRKDSCHTEAIGPTTWKDAKPVFMFGDSPRNRAIIVRLIRGFCRRNWKEYLFWECIIHHLIHAK